MHLEFVVRSSTPRALARAVQRAMVLRAAALVPVVAIAVACASIASGLTHSAAYGVVTGLGLVALWAATVGIRTVQLGAALVGRGYEPGSTVTADWDDESVTVTTAAGGSRIAFADVAWIRRTGTATTMYVRRARFAIVLPAELVADAGATRLVTLTRRGAGTAPVHPAPARRAPDPSPPGSPHRSQADTHWRFRD